MSDITMCSGKNCPLKRNCKRFTSNLSEAEEYFTEPPYDWETKICEMFWNEHTEQIYKQLKDITSGKF
jgi:hypothetical protein